VALSSELFRNTNRFVICFIVQFCIPRPVKTTFNKRPISQRMMILSRSRRCYIRCSSSKVLSSRLHSGVKLNQITHSNIDTSACHIFSPKRASEGLSFMHFKRRYLHCSPVWAHGGLAFQHDSPQIKLTFVDPKKDENEQTKVVNAYVGDNLMRTAHKNGIDLEGACEGVCACSTCHVILDAKLYNSLPEATEDEEDMLDMAFGLTNTSRLGCQVIVTPEMDGQIILLPKATRNFYVDGHIPKPH